jgi:hypothetical protein
MLAQKIKYLGIDLLMPKLLVVAVEIDASNDQLWDEDEQALWSQAVTEIIEHSVLDRNHGAICTDNYGKYVLYWASITSRMKTYCKSHTPAVSG